MVSWRNRSGGISATRQRGFEGELRTEVQVLAGSLLCRFVRSFTRAASRGGDINATETAATTDQSLARDILRYSLESLRNDTVISRDMQQRIWQVFATVFASMLFGGLVYASQDAVRPDGRRRFRISPKTRASLLTG
jgi:hypothetical protein